MECREFRRQAFFKELDVAFKVADARSDTSVDAHVCGRTAGTTPPQRPRRQPLMFGKTKELSELDVEESALKDCAELSLSDGSIIYNARMVFDEEEVLGIYRKAY